MSSGENGYSLSPRNQLAIAISAAIAGTQSPTAMAADELAEIIVTARKRSENLQVIPESIQAISADDVLRAGLRGLEDTARLIPSLSFVATAPGANKLIFRGVADTNRSFFSDTSAAIYLDDQPLTQPSQTPEPRLVDIERIEALAGPQGSLYGASAQSGTLIIVTKKPDPENFEISADATIRKGSSSDMSYDVSGVVNMPLIQDKLAIRLVGFSAKDGGFIDNVFGESAGGTFDNASVVKKNTGGEGKYLGGRAALRWIPNDKWTITPSVVYQDLDTTGNYDYEPDTAGNLKKVRFINEKREDTWTQFGLTVEGDLGFAQLVSATAYFTRDILYNLDNTAYASYLYTTFGATYVNYALGPDPMGLGWRNPQSTQRFSQEIRLSREGEQWSWIAGLYYEHFHDHWDFRSRIANYEDTDSYNYWDTLYDLEPGTSDNAFYRANNKTATDQYAGFGELTFHPGDHWAFTFGGRVFTNKRDRTYFIAQPANHIAADFPSVTHKSTSDVAWKGNIQYTFDDERMIYLLYSEGFRNGGGNIIRDQQVIERPEFDPDFLQNYELGFKSRWLDSRLQANVTLFHMVWKDHQTEVTDPGPNFATVVINAGDAEINGVELQLSAVPVEGLELDANLQNLFKAELTDDVVIPTDDIGGTEILYAKGARLAITPDFKASASAQYTFQRQIGSASPYARVEWSYQNDSLSDLECNTDACDPVDTQHGYTLLDAKIGLESDSWEVNVFADNITDKQAELYVTHLASIDSPRIVTVNRPREFGIRFMKKWGGGGGD